MSDTTRLSFESDLSEEFRNIDLESLRREVNLTTVNEEEEQHGQQEQQQYQEHLDRQEPVPSIEAVDEVRPMTFRRATDPVPPTSTSIHLRPAASAPMGRSRTRSPYARSHLRSKSNSSSSTSHPMTRAYSSPLSESVSELTTFPPPSSYSRPESPMGMSYGRRASPRRHLDEPFSYTPTDVGTPSVPTIEEDEELSLSSPTFMISEESVLSPTSPFHHSTFPRQSRRRPSSPLYSVVRTQSPGAHALHTSSSVPSLQMSRNASASIPATPTASNLTSPASRYNESYPMSPVPERASSSATLSSASSMYSLSMGSSIYSGSSMPSTPTSMRSRSPSISSLDTIPDSPDAEAEAIEQENIERIERLERLEKLRSMVGNRDGEEAGRRVLGGSITGRERKRWSVCGAERRGDLEMETIWED